MNHVIARELSMSFTHFMGIRATEDSYLLAGDTRD